jgi:hypothetical protein
VRAAQHLGAGNGQPLQTLAATAEDLEAELVLELAQLLGQPRLRGVDASRRDGDVHARIGDGDQAAQLGQGHINLFRKQRGAEDP